MSKVQSYYNINAYKHIKINIINGNYEEKTHLGT